jgi:hypothetical protein
MQRVHLVVNERHAKRHVKPKNPKNPKKLKRLVSPRKILIQTQTPKIANPVSTLRKNQKKVLKRVNARFPRSRQLTESDFLWLSRSARVNLDTKAV